MKMSKINMTGIILTAVEDLAYAFAIDRYPHSRPYKALLDFLFEKKVINVRQKYHAKQVVDRMVKNKLISLAKNGRLRLTEDGKRKLADLEFRDFEIIEPKVWDKKYRVIIFDIGVEKNRIRDAVRRQLMKWGFVRVQNSVWVHPYECQEVVALLKEHFGVAKNVVYMTVESIENDGQLKKTFGLN